MEPAAFVAACVALLATPGPTNTLLATSGAALGVRRSLPLLAAELLGYLAAIVALRIVVGPVIASAPAFGVVLRLLVMAYLLVLATRLWRHGARHSSGPTPVSPTRVFVTTLLNPKGIIFAFSILPQDGIWSVLSPWLVALAIQIAAVGSCWIVAGAVLQRGFSEVIAPGLGYRFSAVVLALLAGVVGAHAFS